MWLLWGKWRVKSRRGSDGRRGSDSHCKDFECLLSQMGSHWRGVLWYDIKKNKYSSCIDNRLQVWWGTVRSRVTSHKPITIIYVYNTWLQKASLAFIIVKYKTLIIHLYFLSPHNLPQNEMKRMRSIKQQEQSVKEKTTVNETFRSGVKNGLSRGDEMTKTRILTTKNFYTVEPLKGPVLENIRHHSF